MYTLIEIVLIVISLVVAISAALNEESVETKDESHLSRSRYDKYSITLRSSVFSSSYNKRINDARREYNYTEVIHGKGNSSHNFDLLDGRGSASSIGIGAGRGGEHITAKFRHSNKFGLEDSVISNYWAGPAAGTSRIRWTCIASDSIGINLVAGTNSSKFTTEAYINSHHHVLSNDSNYIKIN